MDEPFGALDALTREEHAGAAASIWLRERKTVMFVTHDIREAVFLVRPRRRHVGAAGPHSRDLPIDLPRPRPRELTESVAFNQVVAHLRRTLESGYAAAVSGAIAMNEVATTEARPRAAARTRRGPSGPPCACAAAPGGAHGRPARGVGDRRRRIRVSPLVLPRPSQIFAVMILKAPELLRHSMVTGGEVLLGFLIAIVLGSLLGVVIALSPLLGSAIYPVLVSAQVMPKVAIAPLLVIWLGFGLGSKFAMTALIAFFLISSIRSSAST